jgi:zinc protease
MMQILTVRGLRVLAAFVLVVVFVLPSYGQLTAEPIREQLLNGLRILIWPRPGSQELTIKLRIHSGAAFDIAGKAGGMILLSDLLFPDPATIEFFTEEMSGKLDVNTDLNSITITMQGRASELERIIEILRNALVNTQISPEIVARQRERRIKIVKETSLSPSTVADRAIAARFFGDYPYGRPVSGSAEDLSRVERADLMMARDRFLNSNNATLAIVGGVDKNRTMRALRQLLGSWRKSERIVPTTFRGAEPPNPRTLLINMPTDQTAEVRLAVRGVARADADYNAANILALVAQERWLKLTPELAAKPSFVRNEAQALPGIFVLGAAINSKSTVNVITTARKALDSLVTSPVTAVELETARNQVSSEFGNRQAKPETLADLWLDVDTFQLAPISEQMQSLRKVEVADLVRVANRLFRDQPVASVVLGDTKQLKTELEGQLQIEVLGEIVNPKSDTLEIKAAPKPNTVSKP